MHKIKLISFLGLILFFNTNCSTNNTEESGGYSIKGNISLTPEWRPVAYLNEVPSIEYFFMASPSLIIDSATIDKEGNFHIEGDSLPYDSGFYRLSFSKKGKPPASIYTGRNDENYIFLILHKNSDLKINADANNFTRSYTVEGSAINKRLKEIRKIREDVYVAGQEVGKKFQDGMSNKHINNDSLRTTLQKEFFGLLTDNKAELKKFIDTSNETLSRILATAYYDIDQDLGDDLRYFEKLNTEFRKDMPNSKYVSQFNQRIIDHKTVLPVGSQAPDILLPDSTGKMRPLHSFGNKKLILIDFWASWCKPCREENKHVVRPLYSQYRDQGFEVYGVSLDTERHKWLRAIREDSLNWIHVSNLVSPANSEAADRYKVFSLPTTYLLDGDMKILAKDKRGFELKEFIESTLEK